MDFKILTIDGQQVLLQRIQEDNTWNVNARSYVQLNECYEEWWVGGTNPHLAHQYIAEFSELRARQFLTRAKLTKANGAIDFKIMALNGQQVLLERVEFETGWQVVISAYSSIKVRYDEWVVFLGPTQARQYIAEFSITSLRQFLTRAKEELIKTRSTTA